MAIKFKSMTLLLLITSFFYINPVFAKNKSFGSQYCNDNQFTCYKVKKGDTWEKLFSDEAQRDLVMRINRINTRLYAGMQIAIPKSTSANINIMDYSPLPKKITASGEKTIIVSISNLAFGAYNDDGTLEKWGPVSTARGYCPDIGHGCHTATGKFHIYLKEGAGCVSSKFPVGRGGAPMPYCMFFHGGYALHGSYEVPGYNASHGCVRMFVNDAKWLNQEFTAGEDNVNVWIQK